MTISQSYETSARLDQGELDGLQAFVQGKFKVRGKMHKMMQLGRPLARIQKALATVEIEY